MKSPILKHRLPDKSVMRLLAVAVSAMLLPLGSPVFASTAAQPVGEVSLVLGKAWIQKSGERPRLVEVGAQIGVHDRIETGSNGHVHIRFVDDALVSVRPSSTLDIVRYDYDAAAPERSAVKLDLEEGVARAISGKAAKEARQNFRLNTPVAAIGVRGTDFAVSASRNSMRAQVTEGAIVVAPFSSDCTAAAFGPCSVNALELTGMSNQIVEISSATLAPVLLPTTATGASDPIVQQTMALAAPSGDANKEEKSPELYTESVSVRAVNTTIAARPVSSGKPPTTRPEFTPPSAVSAVALNNNQLVWGRWSDAGARANERITVAYATAKASDRAPTVGNNIYALYRSEAGSTTQEVQRGLGVLGFALHQAQAMFTSQQGSELMSVQGGQLTLDFDLSRFSTSLQLNHAATGDVFFSDSGRIFGGGIFHSRSGSQVTAGAVSLDGKEAGYFFEKSLENGQIDGLTLWGVKP